MQRALFTFLTVLIACRPGGTDRPAVPDPAVLTAQLTEQFSQYAEAWNRGDLEGFLSSYAQDSSTSFISDGHLRRGYSFIHDMYAPRFTSGAPRDSLRFEELEARPLTPTLALVTARWELYGGGAGTSSGPFTLLMERQPDGWKILHDHSSSDQR